jgi:hypothetical protein
MLLGMVFFMENWVVLYIIEGFFRKNGDFFEKRAVLLKNGCFY